MIILMIIERGGDRRKSMFTNEYKMASIFLFPILEWAFGIEIEFVWFDRTPKRQRPSLVYNEQVQK